jgi:hypothetical protein
VLGERATLRVLENKVLNRIFDPNADVIAGRRKLHNKELQICTFQQILGNQIKEVLHGWDIQHA